MQEDQLTKVVAVNIVGRSTNGQAVICFEDVIRAQAWRNEHLKHPIKFYQQTVVTTEVPIDLLNFEA